MAKHRAPRRRAPRGGSSTFLLIAVLGTGALVGTGVGVVTFQDAPASAVRPPAAFRSADLPDPSRRGEDSTPTRARVVAPEAVLEPVVDRPPAASGKGRRVVFSQSAQRVWLMADDETVQRTYLVSGSVYDNLRPGTYAVWSRSEEAVGIDDSGTMRWFVRFAHGPRAAIGFHDIPVADGEPLQTEKQLGTPLSHGCIRQRNEDAVALWEFAPVGTAVVVVA